MFESRVLGVDPGLARLGLAVVEGNGRKAALVWAGAVSTAAGSDESERLRQMRTDHACDQIGTAAGRVGHDDADRL